MIHITEKTGCCGCTACANICPKQAICMSPDDEGFLYPDVNLDKCIDCGLCEKVCPVFHNQTCEENTEGYIIRYKNEKIVEESTSGGAFTAFATYFLKEGYQVYGAGYDGDMQVICKMASTPEELQEMRGSKFVQSNLGETFKTIKKQLKEGQKILFTGTPCQVSGLKSFLGGKADNLFCIDFVCRGVPSPSLWKNYVDVMEKKHGAKMIGARFKHKTYGYHTTTMKIDFANGKTWYGSGRVDPMMKAFVREMASRPSCAACAFKGVERQSDVTMFDCYEFSQLTGKPDDDKGYTSLFIHTNLGKSVFENIKPSLEWLPKNVESLISNNGVMVRNSAKPHAKRDEFYKLVAVLPIDEAMAKIEPITKKDLAIEGAKDLLHRTGLIKLARKLRKKRNVQIND